MQAETPVEDNYAFICRLLETRTQQQVADLTEYGIDSVIAWCTTTESPRWRPVPDRAVLIAKMKLEADANK